MAEWPDGAGRMRQQARAVLGVTESATPDEIDRAFRRLAQRWHPDHDGDEAVFRTLVAARASLATPPAACDIAPVMFVRTQPWWRRLLVRLTRGPVRAPRVR